MNRTLFACRTSILAVAFLVFSLVQAHAQCDPHAANPPSPPAQASVTLSGKSITIDYCAPSARGRKIFGGIIPYDHWWRTGANTSTTLKTETDLRIGTIKVPAGTYSIYSIPSATAWKLIVNKQTGQWGTVYKPEMDLGQVNMTAGDSPSSPVETFKITFEHTAGNKTQLHLIWENTNVYVPVEAVK
ncbi:hypothetical protein HNQ77_005130 [Silvibacterium bohemicum]|uniref:DUF2911 domain-containing protein n=1 Tax=Silvibacterium bohemicum TaxID=1577686 RepID=A0A841K2B6_9BACT|nr:DUF2911 domain-containing protein [Silvibacterium bohemicum]MBB6147145.1 hypothetical protein [Silvibacterium bohemicum]